MPRRPPLCVFVQRTMYNDPRRKRPFQGKRVNVQSVGLDRPYERRLREAQLDDNVGSRTECSDRRANVSSRTDCDPTSCATDGVTIAPRRRDFDGADMSPLTLCSAMASLCHRFASTWNQPLEIAR